MSDRQIAEWVKDTCLLFGTSVDTAFTVAALFVQGLQQDRIAPPDAGEGRR